MRLRWPGRKKELVSPMTSVGRSLAPAAGFSPLELERAGLTEVEARRLGLNVDTSRASALGSNVMQLERLLGKR